MPTNVEIKAVLRDRATVIAWAEQRSTVGPETLRQEDVFFPCESARLKMRVLAPKRGELIRYERTDTPEVRCSHYTIARTEDPDTLIEILTKTLGTIGVVRKTRLLYRIGQTRVHIDQVEGLGDFLELEVVMRPGQSEEEGQRIASALLFELGVRKEDLLELAYIDMLAHKHR